VSKTDEYRAILPTLDDWDSYLLAKSGLPGPRGNIELAQVVADLGDLPLFRRYLAYTPDIAPVNSPYEFLAFCGVVGLGRLLADGDSGLLGVLRLSASDPRWRIREAVAMALQRLGKVDMPRLIAAMRDWSTGTPLEQRAAAAALCEPRLLTQAEHARAVLSILDGITASIARVEDRRDDGFVALRKGLGYCWSVAVAALPAVGKPLMEKWLRDTDVDVRWIMRENLGKARLARMDARWVETLQLQVPLKASRTSKLPVDDPRNITRQNAPLPPDAIQPESRTAWHQWLQEHHDQSKGVWLVRYKRPTGKPRIEYEDAVEEALCFGWIDSTARTLDDQRSMIWFTPRKPKSGWAASNKKRVERLLAAGLLQPAGLAKVKQAKTDGSWYLLDSAENLDIPADLAAALAAYPSAKANFDAFPDSVKKTTLGWIRLAKRAETRAARVDETARLASKGIRVGQRQNQQRETR
jgi:uncharacterized protein YdeI (YjbR/CyaY-like superfamily)